MTTTTPEGFTATCLPGAYSIGSKEWNGLSKLVEEMGELGQVLGKIVGSGGNTAHWDGSDLAQRVREECADVQAALQFFVHSNGLDYGEYSWRVLEKTRRFREWDAEARAALAKAQAAAR